MSPRSITATHFRPANHPVKPDPQPTGALTGHTGPAFRRDLARASITRRPPSTDTATCRPAPRFALSSRAGEWPVSPNRRPCAKSPYERSEHRLVVIGKYNMPGAEVPAVRAARTRWSRGATRPMAKARATVWRCDSPKGVRRFVDAEPSAVCDANDGRVPLNSCGATGSRGATGRFMAGGHLTKALGDPGVVHIVRRERRFQTWL